MSFSLKSIFYIKPRQRSLRSEFEDRFQYALHALILLLIIGFFILDIYTARGVVDWVMQLIPLALSLWLTRPIMPIVVGGLITIALAIGYLCSQDSEYSGIAFMNRSYGAVTIWVLALIGYYFVTVRMASRRYTWIQKGRSGLSTVMAGEQSPAQLGSSILKYVMEYTGAITGALHLREENSFKKIAASGMPASGGIAEKYSLGEGLHGQAAIDGKLILLNELPDNMEWVQSTFLKGRPRSAIIAPCKVDHSIVAMMELAFLEDDVSDIAEFSDHSSESIASALRSAGYRKHLQLLLEETQRQAEELQVQSEELRVNNEELEEQSRALQESQTRLEQQQVELEQSNAQLEEQTHILQTQRDDLAKNRSEIERKASELEQASRYKSEFLANMSHELRTPLNSSLILAKLLAENVEGNLSEDQVNSAETIHSAGVDLLNLINDILDLSKIESGRMEVRPDSVWISHLLNEINSSLKPLANHKHLKFEVLAHETAPEVIFTDRQRLEQVLKNLISNAIKFTDHGHVSLIVSRTADGRVAFEVSDSGIGIPKHFQQLIFEAFHQVDSATNRKFSGTGLGLSISRQLVQLLGGEIRVDSEPRRGSSFTVLLPVTYEEPEFNSEPIEYKLPSKFLSHEVSEKFIEESEPAPDSEFRLKTRPEPQPAERLISNGKKAKPVQDDRQTLDGNTRVILVVEDDQTFAKILYDLAHELSFQCLIAMTAEDAVVMARQYLPSAVVLDVGLPDHSGLSVLDQLKHDARTRHIPVHVVSAGDHTEAAIAMGAVGFMQKPVTREKIVETLKGLEDRLVKRMRRVLLVEDDPVQLKSLQKLLGSHDVETVGVQSGAECLKLLTSETFDCMVLDLSLPDSSGFNLLETLSQEDSYSFPPVIVYTGSDLSSVEELNLRKYSKSIIIKGAKSPERLLDEVTLFLHQVFAELPTEQQKMIKVARSREAALEGRRILIVEDDVRNVFALTSILEPRGAIVQIARNGRESLEFLESTLSDPQNQIDLVLMDVMMPEMDGLTATREIRKRPEFKKLPIIVLTAKAMKEDQEACISAGANDYMSKPLDVDKLMSLVRVWIRR